MALAFYGKNSPGRIFAIRISSRTSSSSPASAYVGCSPMPSVCTPRRNFRLLLEDAFRSISCIIDRLSSYMLNILFAEGAFGYLKMASQPGIPHLLDRKEASPHPAQPRSRKSHHQRAIQIHLKKATTAARANSPPPRKQKQPCATNPPTDCVKPHMPQSTEHYVPADDGHNRYHAESWSCQQWNGGDGSMRLRTASLDHSAQKFISRERIRRPHHRAPESELFPLPLGYL